VLNGEDFLWGSGVLHPSDKIGQHRSCHNAKPSTTRQRRTPSTQVGDTKTKTWQQKILFHSPGCQPMEQSA